MVIVCMEKDDKDVLVWMYQKRMNPTTKRNYTQTEAKRIVEEHVKEVKGKAYVSKKKKYDKVSFKSEFEIMVQNRIR